MSVSRQIPDSVSSCADCPYIYVSSGQGGTYTRVVVRCNQLLLINSDNAILVETRIPVKDYSLFAELVRKEFGEIPHDCPLLQKVSFS